MSELSVERVRRTVIERKLLAALEEDSGQVAILATEQDLKDVLAALCGYKEAERSGNVLSWERHEQRCRELGEDLRQLLNQAFPNWRPLHHKPQTERRGESGRVHDSICCTNRKAKSNE